MALLRFKNDFLAHYDELCAAVRQSEEPVYIENEDGAAGRRREVDVLAELQKQEDEEGG